MFYKKLRSGKIKLCVDLKLEFTGQIFEIVTILVISKL